MDTEYLLDTFILADNSAENRQWEIKLFGIWHLRAKLAKLAHQAKLIYDENINNQILEVLRVEGVAPFDWLYEVLPIGADAETFTYHRCWYHPKDASEEKIIKGDREIVCGTKIGDGKDYTYEQWDAKSNVPYISGVIKFDRFTGVADIELDSGRFGLIRYHRLKDLIPTITLTNIPFDSTGSLIIAKAASKPGHWFYE